MSIIGKVTPRFYLSLQYYNHREKLREVGLEDKVEEMNRLALRMARKVALKHNKLFASSICNTNIYQPGDDTSNQHIRAMFTEQVQWAKEEGAEFIIAETLNWLGEAKIALDVIKSFDILAVVNFGVLGVPPGSMNTLEHVPIGKACKELLDNGVYLVRANCSRGPEQLLEIVKEIVKLCPPERVAALPLGYRTTKAYPTWLTLRDEACLANNPPFPHGIVAFGCAPMEMAEFTKQCLKLGLKFLGVCCGNSGMLTRAMAEAMGKNPPALAYTKYDSMGTNVYKYVQEQ